MGKLTDICKRIDAMAVELNKTNDIEPFKKFWEDVKKEKPYLSDSDWNFMADHLAGYVRAWRARREKEVLKNKFDADAY